MALIPLPSGVQFTQFTNFELVISATSSGRGLDNREQIIFREARYWRTRYQILNAWDPAGPMGAYLAFLDNLNGRANSFVVPVPNVNGPLDATYGIYFIFTGDSMWFEGGTSNAIVMDGDPNPITSAEAPAGATVIQSDTVDAKVMPIGAHFSHNDFLYRVSNVDGHSIKFNPPLRQPIAAGQVLQVAAPKIRVKLSDDGAVERAHAFGQRQAPYFLDVVEAFER